MRLILILLAAVPFLPASAEQYLLYNSTASGTLPAAVVHSSTPLQGLPSSSAAFVWIFDPSDTAHNPNNYPLNSSGQPAYVAPPAPVNVPIPYPSALKAQIVADFTAGVLPAAAYIDFCKFAGAIDDLSSNAAALQASWSALKASDAASGGPLYGTYPNTAPYNGATITSQIETYAKAANVPLTP